MTLNLTTIILTYNEELHIRRCLKNVCPISQRVIVVDTTECSKMFTTAVPRAVDRAYRLHPIAAHMLLTCLFKAEKAKRWLRGHYRNIS